MTDYLQKTYLQITDNRIVAEKEYTEGPDDIDLILDPKGKGSVDASGARVMNVASGVAATDAINMGQADAALHKVFLDIQALAARIEALEGRHTLKLD